MLVFYTTFVEDFFFVDKLGDRDYRNTKGNVTIHYLPTFQHLCKVDKEHKMFHTDLSQIFSKNLLLPFIIVIFPKTSKRYCMPKPDSVGSFLIFNYLIYLPKKRMWQKVIQ